MPSPGGQCHQLKEPGSDFPVIANQSADWCGNPFPLQRPDFEHVTKEKTDCHVAALLAMTVVDETLAHKVEKYTMLIKADNHNSNLSAC